jgi:dolichyl-diphosphooligosaccharide--protein glycosyltransferase
MEWEEEFRPGGAAQMFRDVESIVYRAVPPELSRIYSEQVAKASAVPFMKWIRCVGGLFVLYLTFAFNRGNITEYLKHADNYARSLSNPQIMWKANLRDGTTVIVDDYYAGYKWIEANTPEDARVMAWWDYGYQITGVANRTSIADGNTWNHEHIATLGYMLTSPEKKAHKYIRHMADYVLVWAGGRGDDMGKSPHLARIANSVFPDHCGDKDPKCERFGFYRTASGGGTPTPMMEKSLLYKLVRKGTDAQATVDDSLFKEVYQSKYGYLRVYQVMNVSKSSKAFGANASNRDCDAPGSWYCTGNYPPALKPLIEKRINFKQLEDFNKQGGEKSAYTKLIEKQKRGEI